MQDAENLRGKQMGTLLCMEANLPGMQECGPNYCLLQTTSSCVLIAGSYIGKDNSNQHCLTSTAGGSLDIRECRAGFCKKQKNDGLFYCLPLLISDSADTIAKEKSTHNCLASGRSSTLGIIECAQGYCISEI